MISRGRDLFQGTSREIDLGHIHVISREGKFIYVTSI